MFKSLSVPVVLFATLIATPAYAYDWVVQGKVVMIESDYMPNQIVFEINTQAGSCPANNFLSYTPTGSTAADKQANGSAVLATLLTAQARSATVTVYGNNSNCSVTNIWIIN